MVNLSISYGIKNPFVSPFKPKTIKSVNRFTGLDLQAIIAGTNPYLNIAIINNKSYYLDSRLAAGKIIKINAHSVVIESKNGKTIKLELKKYEGFQR
jgi:type II secretory pathway component PulC